VPARHNRLSPAALVKRTKGVALGWLHAKPDFLIIGAARSGTGTLLGMLRGHPNVVGAISWELHFFDGPRWNLGEGWYRTWFPYRWQMARAERRGRRPVITGEKSPFYLASPQAPGHIRSVVPDARLIALLRDPTARAVSHWGLRSWKGREDRSFAEAVADELGPDWLKDPAAAGAQLGASGRGGSGKPKPGVRPKGRRQELYVERGVYQPQLERWHSTFPKEQLLLLESEAFFADPAALFGDVCDHLGIPRTAPRQPKHRHANQRPREPEPEVIEGLRELYAPHNRRLAAYLDREFSWS
jgi:hypothetical protein